MQNDCIVCTVWNIKWQPRYSCDGKKNFSNKNSGQFVLFGINTKSPELLQLFFHLSTNNNFLSIILDFTTFPVTQSILHEVTAILFVNTLFYEKKQLFNYLLQIYYTPLLLTTINTYTGVQSSIHIGSDELDQK